MTVVADQLGPITLRVVESTETFTETELTLELSEVLRLLPQRREVYAGQLAGLERAVVAKRFLSHPRQLRDWRREWRGLIKLNELALSAPTPLCVAQEVDGAAIWVVMDRIDASVSVPDVWLNGDADERLELIRQLAKLVDAVHRAGVRQGDQHVDNWAWDGARLYLLDAGSIQFSRSALTERARLLDLAGICVTLVPAAEQAFCEAIRADYLIDDVHLKGRILYHLEEAIIALQKRRTRRYFEKTRRCCSEFVRVEDAAYRAVYVRRANAALIESLLADPEALIVNGKRLKSGNTCTVQEISHAGNDYVLKRYNQQALAYRLRRVCSDSRALTSWSSAWVLEMAFIPTARVIAVYEDRRKYLPGLRYLLMERIKGQLLPDYIESYGQDAARIEMLADAFAQIWASLARLRAVHGDLKATNLIVGEDGRLSLFDLDAFRFGLGARAFERGRAKDFRRFMKNWAERPELMQLFEAKMQEWQT